MALDKLGEILERDMQTNMKNTNASARMQDGFANYHTIRYCNGLKWILTDNKRVVVQNLLS